MCEGPAKLSTLTNLLSCVTPANEDAYIAPFVLEQGFMVDTRGCYGSQGYCSTDNNMHSVPCRISMGCFTMLLYFSAIAYALGAVAAPKQADYRFVDENNGIIDTVAVEDAEGALLADASDTR